MKSTPTTVGASALASQYNALRDDAYGGSMLLPHAQATPGLTLKVEMGVCYVGATRVIYAGGNSPTITAPTVNPRIDLLTIDSAGVIALVTGVEGASPAVPAYPTNKLVLCEIYNRVGETAIYDTDQTTNGYIKADVRPILGGAYIATDAQVDAAAGISISKIAFNGNLIPDTANTRDVGSGAVPANNIYAAHFWKNGVEIGGGKFGGTGADGALAITTGTTTIDLAGAAVVTKNYTSISITGTGKLAFINPHANGTIITLKSQGNVTLTSSTAPMIDCSALGPSGGAATAAAQFQNVPGNPGTDGLTDIFTTYHGVGSTGAGVGAGGVKATLSINDITDGYLRFKTIIFRAAGGGSGHATTSNDAGAQAFGGKGGRAGGTLVIECGGAWNFTTTNGISIAGEAGGNASIYPTNWPECAGGGAGGAAGLFLAIYNTLTANTGTVNVSGGLGGTNVQGPGAGTPYGAGAGGGILAAGGTGAAGNGAAAGTGANGKAIVTQNTEYA